MTPRHIHALRALVARGAARSHCVRVAWHERRTPSSPPIPGSISRFRPPVLPRVANTPSPGDCLDQHTHDHHGDLDFIKASSTGGHQSPWTRAAQHQKEGYNATDTPGARANKDGVELRPATNGISHDHHCSLSRLDDLPETADIAHTHQQRPSRRVSKDNQTATRSRLRSAQRIASVAQSCKSLFHASNLAR